MIQLRFHNFFADYSLLDFLRHKLRLPPSPFGASVAPFAKSLERLESTPKKLLAADHHRLVIKIQGDHHFAMSPIGL